MQNDVHITSFTIGGTDAPLHGRHCKVPYAGNCCLVRRDIKRGVSRIITAVELILESISPVGQLFDGPLQDLVKRIFVISDLQKTDLFPYVCASGDSSDYFTFICVHKHRPVAVLDILDGVYSGRKGHSIWMMGKVLFVQVVRCGRY